MAALCVMASLVHLKAAAQGVELSGVRYEPVIQVASQPLMLNGAGIRYKAVFKVYAAGLYLSSKASTPEAVLTQAGPKRLHISMLRDIDANELGRLFTRGLEDNAPREEFSRSINGLLRMGEIFSTKKRMSAGETISVDWMPGAGTVIRINGVQTGEPIKEREFYNALMRIWLGPSPVDRLLKDALLGLPR